MAPRPPFVWATVVAAILQAASLLVVAVVGLAVSYSFCDTSGALQPGYCDVRGVRWVLWMSCQVVLLLAGVAVPVLALIGVWREGARRRLLQVEGVVAVAALCSAVMYDAKDTASMGVPFGLMLLTGVAVVAGMRVRGKPGTP
jgi:hypothetical protein